MPAPLPPLHHQPLTPPQPPMRLRAVALAVLVHVGLIGALVVGMNLKRPPEPVMEAELWSALPEQAAPAAPSEPEVAEPP
ncbi:hypothetical protein EII18_12525, partial [Comamonadaceae bacterium OH3737_COT-264]